MKSLSPHALWYLLYSVGVCGYFTAASVGRWSAPEIPIQASSFSAGALHSGGSSYGRSSGGFWGGGK